LVSQPKPIYREGLDTGDIKPAWQRQTEHWCDIVIYCTKIFEGGRWIYKGIITKCRIQRAFNAEIEDITYEKLRNFMITKLGVKSI